MIYSNKTSFYRIPIAMDGDLLNEADNVQQMQMIGNSLEAGNGIVTAGVIKEGSFVEIPDSGSGRKLLLQPISGISIDSLMNGGLARSSAEISWEGLYSGNFYYIYLQTFNDDIFRDPTAFVPVIKTIPVSIDNNNFLYLATYDLTGESPVLNTNPFGKIYAYGFTKHISDQSDPHSSTWTQTNLTVTGSLNINLKSNQSINVNQESILSSAPLVVLSHAAEGSIFRETELGDIRITENGDIRIIEGNVDFVPIIRSTDEFIFSDIRTDILLSETGEISFDNEKDSVVGAINENYEDNTNNTNSITTNTNNIKINTENIQKNIGGSFVDLGSGTYQTANRESSPVNIWYRRTVCQFVYTATELIAAGTPISNPILNKIGWYVTQSPVYDIPGYTIKMKHVTASDVSSPLGTGGWTEVKSAFTYSPTEGGYDLIDFDQNFVWNGVDNIGIEVCWSQVPEGYSASGKCRFYSVYDGYIYGWTDSSGDSCGEIPYKTSSHKPQARIALVGDSSIESNRLNIEINTENILENQIDINQNMINILTNKNSITGNISNISLNSNNIFINTNAITGNALNLATNASNITTLIGQSDINSFDISYHTIQLLDTRQRIEALECAVFGWCSSSSSSSSILSSSSSSSSSF